MASGGPYYEDLLTKREVNDQPQDEEMADFGEHPKEPVKPNVAVSRGVRELLECPVCLNAMYPPIHQEHFMEVLFPSAQLSVLESSALTQPLQVATYHHMAALAGLHVYVLPKFAT